MQDIVFYNLKLDYVPPTQRASTPLLTDSGESRKTLGDVVKGVLEKFSDYKGLAELLVATYSPDYEGKMPNKNIWIFPDVSISFMLEGSSKTFMTRFTGKPVIVLIQWILKRLPEDIQHLAELQIVITAEAYVSAKVTSELLAPAREHHHMK